MRSSERRTGMAWVAMDPSSKGDEQFVKMARDPAARKATIRQLSTIRLVLRIALLFGCLAMLPLICAEMIEFSGSLALILAAIAGDLTLLLIADLQIKLLKVLDHVGEPEEK